MNAVPPADTAAPLPRPILRRALDDTMLVGVCAGVARAVGVPSGGVRLAWIAGTLVAAPLMIVLYAVLAVVVPREDGRPLVGGQPPDAAANLRGWLVAGAGALVLLGVAGGSRTLIDLVYLVPGIGLLATPFGIAGLRPDSLLLLVAAGAMVVVAGYGLRGEARPAPIASDQAPTEWLAPVTAPPKPGPSLLLVGLGALTVATALVTALAAVEAFPLPAAAVAVLLAVGALGGGVVAIVCSERRHAGGLLAVAMLLAAAAVCVALLHSEIDRSAVWPVARLLLNGP